MLASAHVAPLVPATATHGLPAVSQQPANWRDDAGIDPDGGQTWRVCDMVARGADLLGHAHGQRAAVRWVAWYGQLTEEQREQYRAANGPRARGRR